MKRCAEYKDSGVEWIGEIPLGWEIQKIKYLFTLRNERNYLPMEEVRLLSLYTELGVLPHDELEKTTGNKAVTVEEYKKVYKDDIVVNIILCWMGAIGVSNYDGVTSPAYDIYQPTSSLIDSRYYHHLFRTPMFSGACYKVGRGIMAMRWRTYSDEFKSLKVPLPPLCEQKKILDYLDHKTSALDTLIADKQKLIDLLKEKRQVIISEAVTKGLDKTTKLKDSGIEWIGEIPEGWAMSKIKYVTSKVGSGKTPRGGNEVYVNEGIIFIRSQNVYDMGLLLDDVAYITDEMDEELSNTRLEYEDILLNITGASIGRCCVWKEPNCRANVNQHVCIIRTSKTVLAEYLHLVLVSFVGKTLIDICQSGANRQGLNFEEIANFYFPLPTAYEQSEIVSYLDQKTSAIDTLITDITTQIDKLKEYRQSVIRETVTGKVAI